MSKKVYLKSWGWPMVVLEGDYGEDRGGAVKIELT